MSLIDTYKEKIGYGARNNLFKVQFTIPTKVSEQFNKIKSISASNLASNIDLMIDRINMPHTRNIETVSRINFGNEYFTIAKSRQLGSEAYEEITLNFRNTEDYIARDLFSLWINMIQKPRYGTYTGERLLPSEYKTDSLKIQMLDKDMTTVIREVVCNGCFPLDVDNMDLGYEAGKEEIRSTEVRLSVDYYTTNVLDYTL
jgi:hypothetical protein